MNKPYEGKDGIKRDVARIGYELGQGFKIFGITFWEFITLKGGVRNILHNYVDIWVETLRATPYALGHLLAIFVPVVVIYSLLP